MTSFARRRSAGQISGDEIVIEAAWMYYHDGMNQNEIADRLKVSRPTVVNYLQEARERGFVRVSLSDNAFTDHRVALALRAQFNLTAAYVVPDHADPSVTLARVGRGAAEWLPALLAPGDRLGVAWGQTIFSVTEALDPTATSDIAVVQLVGSMATPYGFAAEICSVNMAQRLGAKCLNLYAPAVLSDAGLARRLRDEPVIKAQLDALDTCNKAIFAAGSTNPDSHIVLSGVATPDELAWYVAHGAKGVLCGRFIDRTGRPIEGSLSDRIIGATLDKLLGLDMGMLVSAGEDKVVPILAAIAGGYVTHVVTSRATAEQMLALADSSNPPFRK